MDADGGVAKAWVVFCESDGVLAFHEIRSSHHHLLHACGLGAGDDAVEVIGMCFFAVVDAAEDGIRKVDSDLPGDIVSRFSGRTDEP